MRQLNEQNYYAAFRGLFGDDLDIFSKRHSHLDARTCHNSLALVNLTMADPPYLTQNRSSVKTAMR